AHRTDPARKTPGYWANGGAESVIHGSGRDTVTLNAGRDVTMDAVADELLRTLAEDVRRALRAGADAAATDEGLRRHAAKLGPLARQAPVLARLSEMLERLQSPNGRRAPALLDLLLAAGQVRAQGATSGVKGPLVAVPRSGPWATPLAVAVVSAVCDGVLRRG